jgi:protein-disulfide isomerase
MKLNHPHAILLGLALIGATIPPPTAAPPPREPLAEPLDLKSAPVKGPADAPIKVAEYSDFLCPHCKLVAAAFGSYVPQAANRVAIYYKFYPLDGPCNPGSSRHPGACWLAYGGVCAQEQGDFWKYHDAVFARLDDYTKTAPDRASVLALASELGYKGKAFEACLDAPGTKARVVSDVTEGTRVGVRATPSLFVNNRPLNAPNEFLPAVDQESRRLGLGPMPTQR